MCKGDAADRRAHAHGASDVRQTLQGWIKIRMLPESADVEGLNFGVVSQLHFVSLPCLSSGNMLKSLKSPYYGWRKDNRPLNNSGQCSRKLANPWPNIDLKFC